MAFHHGAGSLVKSFMAKYAWLKRGLLLGAGLFALVAPLRLGAQSGAQIAGMAQDIQILNKKVKQLSLQGELFESRQRQLQQRLDSFVKQQTDLVREFNALTVSINARLQTIEEREPAIKREILAEVAEKMTQLAKEMEMALDAVAKAIEKTPQPKPAVVQFDDDYPTTGIAYIVKAGDSLSKIAREQNSTVRDIQNANKIVNPRTDLQVGQTIFVPQRNE